MEQKKNAIRPVFENLRKLALYTGVSLGALALSGCSVKEEYDPYATDVLKQDYAEMVSYPVTIYASNYEELEEKDHLFFGDDKFVYNSIEIDSPVEEASTMIRGNHPSYVGSDQFPDTYTLPVLEEGQEHVIEVDYQEKTFDISGQPQEWIEEKTNEVLEKEASKIK